MTRRVDTKWLLVAGGLALMLTGCATHGATSAGVDAANTGSSAQDARAGAASGAGQAGEAGRGGAAGPAAGGTPFPVLPSPQDLSGLAATPDTHLHLDR